MNPDIRQVRQRVTTGLHTPDQSNPGQEAAMAAATSATSGPRGQAPAGPPRGRIQWVRAQDLLQHHATRLAEWHARGQENLVTKMRHGMRQITPNVSAPVVTA